MAENEIKDEKVIKNTPKRKKAVKKENTKAQKEIVEVKEEVKEVFPEYHISRVGDTSYNVALLYGKDQKDIEELNKDINWLNLKEGKRIRIS